MIVMFACAAAQANILMKYFKFYPIFSQKICKNSNITVHLSIFFINYNKFRYKNIKNMHFLYLKFFLLLKIISYFSFLFYIIKTLILLIHQ